MHQQPHAPSVSGQDEYLRLLTLLDERRFEEAQIRARVLLENADTDNLVRAKTHNLACWTFIEGLKYTTPEAVLHGEEAARLALAIGEHELYLQALCNLASAYHQLGDYDLSRQTYDQITSHLTKSPALLPCGLVLAYQGLSQLDLVQERPESALDHLETARKTCQAEEECRFLLADIYRRQALTLVQLDRPEEAAHVLTLIDENAFSSGPRTLWWKTHLSFTRARVEVAQGHWTTARPLVVNTMALARELHDMPVLAESACLLALIEQAEARKGAGKRARAALTYAIHSGRRDVVDEVRTRLRTLLASEL